MGSFVLGPMNDRSLNNILKLLICGGGDRRGKICDGGLGCLGEGAGLELVVAGLGMSGGHSPMKGSGVMAPGRGEGTRRL